MARLGAGIRKRNDGTLEKRITIDGKRYSIYGKTTKEIATKEQEVRNRAEQGLYKANMNITLDKYFNEWLERKKKEIKGNTIRRYRSIYDNQISACLGSKKVCKIERRDVLALQKSLSEKQTISYTNEVVNTLKIVLNGAIQDEIILRNPANVKALKDTEEKARDNIHRALTEIEQKAFMQELREDYYYEFIALMLCSGMRFGEVGALTWQDVDYKNNVIHVTKTLTMGDNNKMVVGDSPKTKAGTRDIPLTDTIKGILMAQKGKLGNIAPIGNTNVFLSVYGHLVRHQSIERAIKQTLNRLEEKGVHIEHFTSHALRDTFATRYIEQGGTPQTLKTILGHSSLAMTMDLYAHVLPNTKQSEMDKLHIAI